MSFWMIQDQIGLRRSPLAAAKSRLEAMRKKREEKERQSSIGGVSRTTTVGMQYHIDFS